MIRPATINDAPGLAKIHVGGWQASYAGLVDQDYLDNLDPAQKEREWIKRLEEGVDVLIAHDDAGNPTGFISFGKLRTPIPGGSPIRPLYTAEIYAIYILPDYWRAGLGRRLMASATATLLEKKHKSACLWVMEGNKSAISFYKTLGGQRCGSKKVEVAGRMLSEIAFGWRDITTLQMSSS